MSSRPTGVPGGLDELVALCDHTAVGASGPIVVAVDGHSAAGKSTVADRLGERFDAVIVRGDDFYSVMDEEARAALAPNDAVDEYYDWRRMRDVALRPLAAGHRAEYRPYDWDRNAIAPHLIELDPGPMVVIEGLFVARPELSGLIDISVIVESSSDVRAARQKRRADASPAWLRRWDLAERHYLTRIRPPETFDVRVRGDAR